jgi:hypothetical protein
LVNILQEKKEYYLIIQSKIMQLEHLNFDEEPLSREDLLRIKGGASAMYTVYSTGNCTTTSAGTADCPDLNTD